MIQYEYKVVELTENEFIQETASQTLRMGGVSADEEARWLTRFGSHGWCLMARNFIQKQRGNFVHHFIFMRPVR